MPSFRIKHFDEGDYEQTEIEDRHAVAQLIEALRYEPEGRGFDSSFGMFDMI